MTITDTLETVLSLVGAQSLIGGLASAEQSLLRIAEADVAVSAAQGDMNTALAAALLPVSAMIAETKTLTADLLSAALTFEAMAAAEGVAAAATAVLDALLGLLESPLILLIGALAVLTAGALAAGKALSAFSESEATTARLALQMRDLGNVFPTSQLVAFANRLQDTTGISHKVIESLGATAAQFGLTRQQIEKALPVTLDVAAAKGINPEEVLNRILRASRGRTQGLVALGIDPSKLTGDLKDVNDLIDQVGRHFSGVAEGFRNTLPGTVGALSASMSRLWEALGRFISPVVVPLLNALIAGVDKLSALLTRIADLFPRLFPTAASLGAGAGASSIAFKGDPEQTAALQGIEKNTKNTADAFVKAVLGGGGAVARSAFTARDARIAFGI